MKKGVLFLNGISPEKNVISEIAEERTQSGVGVFCTDGAYAYVAELMVPDTVIGDFDSIERNKISAQCEVVTFSSDKNFTDGYLALKIMAERGYDEIDIYGAYGGRPDMAESNYFLLALALKLGVKARFCGDYVTCLTDSKIVSQTKKGATVSLVPFSDKVHILYTRGLKYALADYTMYKFEDVDSRDYVMGVSNVSEEERVEIAVEKGLLLVFIQQI